MSFPPPISREPLCFFLASVSSVVVACIWYSQMAPRLEKKRQKAWIVTFLSSTAMSVGSLPFLWDFLTSRGDMLAVHHRKMLAQGLCGSFQGFLLADLLIGSSDYPEQVSPISGWAHHITYVLLLPYIVSRGWAHVFCTCLAMEMPTFLLASSFLWPKLRNDIVCAFVFFSTRIVLHMSLTSEMMFPRARNGTLDGSFAPACLSAAAFILHASWFRSNVKGIIRRSCKAGYTGGNNPPAREIRPQEPENPVRGKAFAKDLQAQYFQITKLMKPF